MVIIDSSGFGVSTREDWQNAKYGTLSVRLFVKLHIIHTLHGKICAATVTTGTVGDSPILREMIEYLPYGEGDFLGDAAYGCKKNCSAVRDSGRTPIFTPKSNDTIKGFDARSKMLRFKEEHPGTFYKKLAKRNNVESVFSSMKSRFGGIVRATKKKTQKTELLSMAICYNMVM